MRQTSYIETNYQRKDETNVHCRNNGLTCTVSKKTYLKIANETAKKAAWLTYDKQARLQRERD